MSNTSLIIRVVRWSSLAEGPRDKSHLHNSPFIRGVEEPYLDSMFPEYYFLPLIWTRGTISRLPVVPRLHPLPTYHCFTPRQGSRSNLLDHPMCFESMKLELGDRHLGSLSSVLNIFTSISEWNTLVLDFTTFSERPWRFFTLSC